VHLSQQDCYKWLQALASKVLFIDLLCCLYISSSIQQGRQIKTRPEKQTPLSNCYLTFWTLNNKKARNDEWVFKYDYFIVHPKAGWEGFFCRSRNTTTTKDFQIPAGHYSVRCFRTRKSRLRRKSLSTKMNFKTKMDYLMRRGPESGPGDGGLCDVTSW